MTLMTLTDFNDAKLVFENASYLDHSGFRDNS